jgi:hypothetical protein
MTLDIPWRKLSLIKHRLLGRWESYLVRKKCIITHVPRKSHVSRYQTLPVKPDIVHFEREYMDSFAAQLNACRERSWWEQQPDTPNTGSPTPARADSESTKRSLSIRDIRERMDSDRSTVNSGCRDVEWEPGLKFLDGVRGGWKDMEMFVN